MLKLAVDDLYKAGQRSAATPALLRVSSGCYCSHVTVRGCCDHWISGIVALAQKLTQLAMCVWCFSWLPGYIAQCHST